MTNLVDFHCHLDLYPDHEALVAECARLGIYTLAVTTTPKAWPRNKALASATKHVRAALGLHPQIIAERWREIDLWERYLGETRYVGEVGLDAGPRFHNSLDKQQDVFKRVLTACARDGGKILSVHSVRAASRVLDMVEEHLPVGRGTVVLHWFTGSIAEARRAAGLGCYFSVNDQMLRNERGLKLVRSLPEHRLLTETDGPFTAVNGVPSRPSDVVSAVEAIATCRGWDAASCASRLLANLRALTALP